MLTCRQRKNLNKWVNRHANASIRRTRRGPLSGLTSTKNYVSHMLQLSQSPHHTLTPIWEILERHDRQHHHQNHQWGKIFWMNGVHPSSRVSEDSEITCQGALKQLAHGKSCIGPIFLFNLSPHPYWHGLMWFPDLGKQTSKIASC